MRISEEVDALEVMAIPTIPYLVTTRVVGRPHRHHPPLPGRACSPFFATRLTVTRFFGQSAGTYDHYFNQFLPPGDVLFSFGKVLVFAVAVILIHCYYGYNARAGPRAWASPWAEQCGPRSWRSTSSTCSFDGHLGHRRPR